MIFCILFCFALSQTINKCICLVDANQEVVPGQKSETCSIGCPFEDIDFFDHSINEQLDLMSEDFSEEYTGLYLFFVDATNGEETLKLSNIKTSCKNVSLVVGPLQIDAAFKTLKVNLCKGPNIFDYLEFMHIDLVNTILNEENAISFTMSPNSIFTAFNSNTKALINITTFSDTMIYKGDLVSLPASSTLSTGFNAGEFEIYEVNPQIIMSEAKTIFSKQESMNNVGKNQQLEVFLETNKPTTIKIRNEKTSFVKISPEENIAKRANTVLYGGFNLDSNCPLFIDIDQNMELNLQNKIEFEIPHEDVDESFLNYNQDINENIIIPDYMRKGMYFCVGEPCIDQLELKEGEEILINGEDIPYYIEFNTSNEQPQTTLNALIDQGSNIDLNVFSNEFNENLRPTLHFNSGSVFSNLRTINYSNMIIDLNDIQEASYFLESFYLRNVIILTDENSTDTKEIRKINFEIITKVLSVAGSVISFLANCTSTIQTIWSDVKSLQSLFASNKSSKYVFNSMPESNLLPNLKILENLVIDDETVERVLLGSSGFNVFDQYNNIFLDKAQSPLFKIVSKRNSQNPFIASALNDNPILSYNLNIESPFMKLDPSLKNLTSDGNHQIILTGGPNQPVSFVDGSLNPKDLPSFILTPNNPDPTPTVPPRTPTPVPPTKTPQTPTPTATPTPSTKKQCKSGTSKCKEVPQAESPLDTFGNFKINSAYIGAAPLVHFMPAYNIMSGIRKLFGKVVPPPYFQHTAIWIGFTEKSDENDEDIGATVVYGQYYSKGNDTTFLSSNGARAFTSSLKKFKKMFFGHDIRKMNINRNIDLVKFLQEANLSGNWTADNYNWATNNCQHFTAKCIEILQLSRNNPNKYDWTQLSPFVMESILKNEKKQRTRVPIKKL